MHTPGVAHIDDDGVGLLTVAWVSFASLPSARRSSLEIASAAVTIFNIVPALISLPFKRRIKRGYRDLQALERSAAAGTDKRTLLEEWGRIDKTTAIIEQPLRSLGTQWLELRQYMHDMHDRLEAM